MDRFTPIQQKTGVYVILNRANGKQYVGSAAVSLRGRWCNHRSSLRRNCHSNCHLQSAWNKYGEQQFVFLVLAYCEPDKCIAIEQEFIDRLKVANTEYGYNLSPTAGSTLGTKLSISTRNRMSVRSANQSDETKAKISAAMRGRKLSQEHRRKLSQSATGRKLSDSHKAAISKSKRSKKLKHSLETRAKISASVRLGLNRPEVKEKLSKVRMGRKCSMKTRKKMSDSLSGRKLSNEHRAKLSSALKASAKHKAAVKRRWEREEAV